MKVDLKERMFRKKRELFMIKSFIKLNSTKCIGGNKNGDFPQKKGLAKKEMEGRKG